MEMVTAMKKVGRSKEGRGTARAGLGGARGRERRPRPALYFAYGSNLDVDQMANRCPGARLVGRAWLDGHRLAFAGTSRLWGGGVATVVEAPWRSVPGALYEAGSGDFEVLDAVEGHPWFYRRCGLDVRSEDGTVRAAVVYVLDASAHGLALPSEPYLEAIKRGYEIHGFDSAPLADAFSLASSEGCGA